jgi:glutamate---cysteine ligase / carboxylate-amine ligase
VTSPLPGASRAPAPAMADRLPTVGVEEEFLLLWPDGDAACVAPEVIGRLPPDVPAHLEFTRYQVESATGICTDLVTVARQLAVARRALARSAADSGARLVAGGTAPYGAPGVSGLTDDARYRSLVAQVPGISGEEGTCACHVHVGVATRELGVHVLNRIRPWLPVLIALSGNSPLWRGRDTGWSSYRFAVQRRWPSFVPPPLCRDLEEYDAHLAERMTATAPPDARSVYYWARLSPRYPTVEVRIADVGHSIVDAVLLAGLSCCLVTTAAADAHADRPWIRVPDRAVTRAAFAAARRGLAATLVSPVSGRAAPALEVLDELLAVIAPAAEAAGDGPLLRALLAERLRRGSGAERQLSLWCAGRPEALVQGLAGVSAGRDSASAQLLLGARPAVVPQPAAGSE